MTVTSYQNMTSFNQPATSLNCSKEIVYGVPANEWLATRKKTKDYLNQVAPIYFKSISSNKPSENERLNLFYSFPHPLLTKKVQKGLRAWLSAYNSTKGEEKKFCTYQTNNSYYENSYRSILNIIRDLSKVTKYTWRFFFQWNSYSNCPGKFNKTTVLENVSHDGIFQTKSDPIFKTIAEELKNLKNYENGTKNENQISEYINNYPIPALNSIFPYINHLIEILIESGGNKNIFSKEFFNKLCNTLVGPNYLDFINQYSFSQPIDIIDDSIEILELVFNRIYKNNRIPLENEKKQAFHLNFLHVFLPLTIPILGLIAYRLKKPCNTDKRAYQENLQLQETKESSHRKLNEYVVLSQEAKSLFETLPKEFKEDPGYLL